MADELLVVTESGYGKRLKVKSIPRTKRSRAGVQISTEPIAAAISVSPGDAVMIATRKGKVERFAVADVPIYGRRSRGVRLLRLGAGDAVARVAVVPVVAR